MSEFDNLKNEAEQYTQQHPDQIKEGEDAVEKKFGMGQGQQGGQQGQGQQESQRTEGCRDVVAKKLRIAEDVSRSGVVIGVPKRQRK